MAQVLPLETETNEHHRAFDRLSSLDSLGEISDKLSFLRRALAVDSGDDLTLGESEQRGLSCILSDTIIGVDECVGRLKD
jgi:hypothetical protein